MKKYISTFHIMLICILLFFGITIWKGNVLHQKYPDPQIETYAYRETAQIGNYEIYFDGWGWGNESLIQKDFPDYQLIYTEDTGKPAEIRVGLIHFTITKISGIQDFSDELEKNTHPSSTTKSMEKDHFDMSNISFSSKTWGNQFDLELFYLLNPQLNSMVLDLSVGEVQEVTLPLVLLEPQFTTTQWAEIDKRTFYMNLQYYPKHIRFVCPNL